MGDNLLANRATISIQDECTSIPKTDLVKAQSSKDDSIEYVLNDPKVEEFYKKNGQESVDLSPTKLMTVDTDMDVIIHTGELLELNKGIWKKRHYVLRKSG